MTEKIKLPLKWEAWTITEEIGSGSYGTVYKALRDSQEGKEYCAIKIIPVIIDEHNEKYIKQFQNKITIRDYYFDIVMNFMVEIRTLELLRGKKNIVEIYDSVVDERTDGSGWNIYIMMEFLDDISNAFFKVRDNDEKEVIRLGIDICSALEICEERNILHRDIKPENIMISKQGDYKLVDFGVAKHIEGTMPSLSLKGTYSYMAPEVVQMKQYGNRADLYSLGLVLYSLMNKNREPFIDINKQYLRYKDKEESVERRLKGEILPDPCNASPGFAEIILKTCEYNPMERYKSASELKKDLIRLRDGKYRLKNRKKKGGLSFIIPQYYAKMAAKVLIVCIGLAIFGKMGLHFYNSCHYQLGDKESAVRIDQNGVMTIDKYVGVPTNDFSDYKINKLIIDGDNVDISSIEFFPSTLEEVEGSEKLSKNLHNDVFSGTKYEKNHTKNDAFVLNGVLLSYTGDKKEVNIEELSSDITYIGDYAFSDCKSVEKVEGFNNVKSIGESAFRECTSLESIEGLENVTSIEQSTFFECKSLESIEGLENVTSIGMNAFMDCKSLESIEGLENVRSIGADAFAGCSLLKSIEGLENVRSIGEYAFNGCTSLERIDGLDDVVFIGGYAFEDTLFKKNHMKNDAFVLNGVLLSYEGNKNEVNLEELSSDIISIGDSAFSDCISLKSIKGLENVTSIGQSAFEGCSSLESIEGLGNVTSIGAGAFAGCSLLKSIEGLENVRSIEEFAFSDCSSLKSIKGLENVTSIERGTFIGCTSLESIKGLENVRSIGMFAFYGCTSLKSIEGLNNLVSIGCKAFDDTVFKKEHIKNDAFIINHILVSYEGNNKEVNINDISSDITSIGDCAFAGCTCLEKLEGLNNITSIGKSVFTYAEYEDGYVSDDAILCTSLKSVSGLEHITSIEECTFCGCSALESIEGLNNITSIGNAAFWGCSSLKSIKGLENVTTIGECAFFDCSKLTQINGLTNSKLKSIKVGDRAFINCPLLKFDN